MAYTGIIPKDKMIAVAKRKEEEHLAEYFETISDELVRQELKGKKRLKIGKTDVADKYKARVYDALKDAGYEIEHHDYYVIARW